METHLTIFCARDFQGQSASLYKMYPLPVFCRYKRGNMSGLRTLNTESQSTISFSAQLHAEAFRCVYLHFLTLSVVLQCKFSSSLISYCPLSLEHEIFTFFILLVYKISIFQNFVYISNLQLSTPTLFLCIYYITVISLQFGERTEVNLLKLSCLTANYHFNVKNKDISLFSKVQLIAKGINRYTEDFEEQNK